MSPAENIYIRALGPDDWRIVKELRLFALKTNPGVFGGNYANESTHSDDQWRDNLTGDNKRTFGLFDGEKLIGITGVFTFREDPSGQTGLMAYTFLRPEYRGRGLSEFFYEARIAFALQNLAWKKLVIGHRDGNEPSRRAMIKHGFVFTHKTRKVWPDGVEADEYHYMMDLETKRKSSN